MFVAYSLGMTLVLLAPHRQPRHGPPGAAARGCAEPCPTSPARRACSSSSPAPTSRTTAGTSAGCERATVGDGSAAVDMVTGWSAAISELGQRLRAQAARAAPGARPRRRAHRHLRPPHPTPRASGALRRAARPRRRRGGPRAPVDVRLHGLPRRQPRGGHRRRRRRRRRAGRRLALRGAPAARRCAGTSRPSRSGPTTPRRWPRSSTTSTSRSRSTATGGTACGPSLLLGGRHRALATHLAGPPARRHAGLRGGRRPGGHPRRPAGRAPVATP